MEWTRRNMHYVVFGTLSLLIMLPVLSGGFVFSVDGYFALDAKSISRIMDIDDFHGQGIILMMVYEILDGIIPLYLVQNGILMLVFFVSAFSMYNLVNTRNGLSRYFAAFFYALNPFIYLRFMAGHVMLLISYALLPFVISSIIRFYRRPDLKRTIKTALWLSVIGMQIQYLLFAIFIMSVFFVFFISKRRKVSSRQILMLALFFMLLNSYWIVPMFAGDNLGMMHTVTGDDLKVFSTNHELISILMTTSMMYGFWRQDAYLLPTDIIPRALLVISFIALVYLCVRGYILSKDEYKTPILLIGIFSLMLSVGISLGLMRPIFLFLFNHMPLFKSFREPDKFVGLLIVMYCYLGSLGLDSLSASLSRYRAWLRHSAWLFITIPFIFTPTMFGSFWGQVHATYHPPDWHEMNAIFNNDSNGYNVLVLPWHMYMDYPWINNNDKRTNNLAKVFFDVPVIVGDNMEAGQIYSQSLSMRSAYVESLIYNRSIEDIGKKLRLLGVKYVLLGKQSDYESYYFLFDQPNLDLVNETENFYLFKNRIGVSRVYQSDVLEDSMDLRPLAYSKAFPAGLDISVPDGRFVIVADDYDKRWKLGDQEPFAGYPVNIYEYRGEREVHYGGSVLLLLAYSTSLMASAICCILLLKRE